MSRNSHVAKPICGLASAVRQGNGSPGETRTPNQRIKSDPGDHNHRADTPSNAVKSTTDATPADGEPPTATLDTPAIRAALSRVPPHHPSTPRAWGVVAASRSGGLS